MRLTKHTKRRLIVLLVVVIMAGGVGAAIVFQGMYRVHRAQLARAEGMAAYERGEHRTALAKLRRSISHNREDVEGLLAFADSRSQVFQENNQHLSLATAIYREVLRLEPDNVQALSALLDLYGRLDLRTEWVDIADRILATTPDHTDALSAKATVAYHSGNFDEAIRLADRLSGIEPQELSWRALHIAASRALGQEDSAILLTIDRWIEDHEQDGRFRVVKAQFLAESGDIDGARREILVAAGLGTDSDEVLDALLNLSEMLGLWDEVANSLQVAKTALPNEARVYELIVRRHWRLLRLEEALEALAQAEQSLGGLDCRLLRWKALVHLARGERAETEAVLDALLRMAAQPDNHERDAHQVWVQAIRSGLHTDEGSLRETLLAYERAIAMHPRDAVLPFHLAQAYRRVGELDLAVILLQKVVHLDPLWVAGQLALADALLLVGRPGEAFESLVTLMRRDPSVGRTAYLLLARAWLRMGDTDRRVGANGQFDGLAMLRELHEQAPGDAEVSSLLAEAYLQSGMGEEATALIEDALADAGTNPRTLQLLAEVSLRWDLGPEGRLLGRLRTEGGLTLDFVSAHAQALARAGRIDEALSLLDAAIEAAPDPVQAATDARPVRLRLLLSAGDQDALAEMARWLRSEPESRAAATFVLGQEEAWRDAELIRGAIDILEAQVGRHSPQVQLAEAAYWGRFFSHDSSLASRAVTQVGDVLERTPDSQPALILMADLLVADPEPRDELAISHLKRAADIYPSDPKPLPMLIFLLQRQGDFESAGRYLARLAPLARSDPGMRQTELALLKRQGDFEQAVTRLGGRVDAHSAEAEQLELASLLLTVGRYSDAEAIYRRLRSGPHDQAVAVAAADFFALTGRFEQGLEILTGLETDGGGAAREAAIGSFYQRHGFTEEAAGHLRRAVELGPTRPEVWAEIANLYLETGDAEAARDAVSRGLALDPGMSRLQATLAAISMSLGEADRRNAITMLESGGPWHPALLPTITLFDRVAGRGEQGEPTDRDLRDAQQLVLDSPDFLPAWRLAIVLHMNAGKTEEAIRLARRAGDRLPAEPEPVELACRLLAQAGRTEEALDTARLWRQRSLANPLPAEFAMAALLLDLDRPAEAVQRLAPYQDRIWAGRDRSREEIALWLGTLVEAGRIDEARRRISILVGEDETWCARCLDLVPRLGPRGAERMISLIQPHLARDPASRLRLAHAWADLVRRFDDAAAYEQARRLAETLISRTEYATDARLLKAEIAMRRGELTVAEDVYRSMLEHNPNDVQLLNNLADVLVRRGDSCAEAVDLAFRAAELAAGHPGVADTIAQALLCQGRYAEAEGRILAALAGEPANAYLLVTLSSILYAQGRESDARAALSDAQETLSPVKWPDATLLRRIEALKERIDGPVSTGGSREP